jgi:hypothetical protein
MKGHTQQLGAQDPERKNSPVAWESDEEIDTLREALPDEEPTCFFNDGAYSHGSVVSSGTVLLRCDNGIWIPAGATESGKV